MASMEPPSCSVCFQSYNYEAQKPKILSCGHTFCSTCLLDLAQRNNNSVVCPFCQREQVVTDVSQLTTNFSILHLVSDSYDDEAEILLLSDESDKPGPVLSAGHCDDHGEYKLFRCKSCGVWICHVCTVTEHPTDECDVTSIKKALREKKIEIKTQIEQNVSTCEETLARLDAYVTELQCWDEANARFSTKLENVTPHFTEAVKAVTQKHSELIRLQEQGLANLEDVTGSRTHLITASKLEEIDDCAQTVSNHKDSAQQWLQKVVNMISDREVVSKAKKVQILTDFALDIMGWSTLTALQEDKLKEVVNSTKESLMLSLLTNASVYAFVEDEGQLFHAPVLLETTNTAKVGELDVAKPPSGAHVMSLVDILRKVSPVYALVRRSGKDVFCLLEEDKGSFLMKALQDAAPPTHRLHIQIPMEALLRAGIVWFKHWFAHRFSNVKYMYQKVTRGTDEVTVSILHPFQERTPPEGAVLLNADVVAMLSPRVVVFLSLAWDGKTQGHLYIELDDDAKRSLQFQLLCCGDNGNSYRQSRLLGVANRGSPGEMVTGGDHDGAGGKSLLPDLPPEEFTYCPVTAGLVASKSNSAQFVIYTRDLPGANDPLGFGKVISGLDVLEEALKVEDICDVTLSDCGCYWYFNF